MLRCPECGKELVEHEPDGKWLRYFECLECMQAFHFVRQSKRCAFVLERGRTAAIQKAS